MNQQNKRHHWKQKKYCGEQMKNIEKELKKLYRDATYYHLIRQGHSTIGAKVRARQICSLKKYFI